VTQEDDLSRLEANLGHAFSQSELLVRALTHRSLGYERAMELDGKPEGGYRFDNERLEFLGDAVLGLVVSESLYAANPDWQEGELTRVRAQLVSRKNMAQVAVSIYLGDFLRLGKGEELTGGRRKLALLANAMEAVIAALFLDAGLDAVRAFAARHILGAAADNLARELRSGAALGDHKSALQEHVQATHTGTTVYSVERETGPDHRKHFQIVLQFRRADGTLSEPIARGVGSTKKKAEQEAARVALAKIKVSEIAATGETEQCFGETPDDSADASSSVSAADRKHS